eukprot:CAMPEP_0170524420 /NCGR_PEP_ID=MMETSP0209-20121228/9857_1 /TAXON_ID=665100 ORGANISM="Litonotus pictus, Strain P1" /NCGR_SAMPLE_ID=MMETSP0209 /ASSEMBLY_ACC=CAM_ASM_000301 /LENGTH=65 /DNA_ID=CAMNT_0010813087 /DNA_START=888 /DNA_END=1085 /DNA_ORIENTATION=-
MSKKKFTIPCLEGVVFLATILLALFFPEFEAHISIFQGLFISVYYVYYFGRLIKQMMRELELKEF